MIEETVPALDAVQQSEEPTQNTQENISDEKSYYKLLDHYREKNTRLWVS